MILSDIICCSNLHRTIRDSYQYLITPNFLSQLRSSWMPFDPELLNWANVPSQLAHTEWNARPWMSATLAICFKLKVNRSTKSNRIAIKTHQNKLMKMTVQSTSSTEQSRGPKSQNCSIFSVFTFNSFELQHYQIWMTTKHNRRVGNSEPKPRNIPKLKPWDPELNLIIFTRASLC